MKAIMIPVLLLCAAVSCDGPKESWTEAEKAILSAPAPVRVLTIFDETDSLVLRTPCGELGAEDIASPAYGLIKKALLETVVSPGQDGVGIAAPQIGISRRVIAVQRFDKEGEPFEVYPNAYITAVRGEMLPGPEGCLSIPGWRGDVLRYRDLDVRYTSAATLKDTVETVQGYSAIIFQHECDHLDGVLYIDKSVAGTLRRED